MEGPHISRKLTQKSSMPPAVQTASGAMPTQARLLISDMVHTLSTVESPSYAQGYPQGPTKFNMPPHGVGVVSPHRHARATVLG